MRQSYIVEPTPDGRLQIRLVILPDIEDIEITSEEDEKRVIIIDPNEDDTSKNVIIVNNYN